MSLKLSITLTIGISIGTIFSTFSLVAFPIVLASSSDWPQMFLNLAPRKKPQSSSINNNRKRITGRTKHTKMEKQDGVLDRSTYPTNQQFIYELGAVFTTCVGKIIRIKNRQSLVTTHDQAIFQDKNWRLNLILKLSTSIFYFTIINEISISKNKNLGWF